MEFGTREILIILGIVVIFGILLDGFRRVRRSHSGSLKLGKRKQAIFDDEGLDELPGELPTGEVRVTKRDEVSAEEVSDNIRRYRESNSEKETSAFRQCREDDSNVVPFQNDRDAESEHDQDPFAEDRASFEREFFEDAPASPVVPEPEIEFEPQEPTHRDVAENQQDMPVSLNEFDVDDEDEAPAQEQVDGALEDVTPQQSPDIETTTTSEPTEPTPESEREPLRASREEGEDLPSQSESFNLELQEEPDSGRRKPFWEEKHAEPAQSPKQRTQKERQSAPGQPSDVIVLHIMAKADKVFAGKELLESLLANDLRFGSMNIFHRHENRDGSGHVLFSLANSLNPGTFDLSSMEEFETPGVTIFMPLEGLADPLDAYKELIKAGQNITKSLNGSLLDETRSVLTKQTIEHYRQQIIEFTRRSFTLTN